MVRSSILKRMSHNSSTNTDNVTEDDNMKMIWIRLPYMGKQGEMITKTLLRKLKRCFKTIIVFLFIILNINVYNLHLRQLDN